MTMEELIRRVRLEDNLPNDIKELLGKVVVYHYTEILKYDSMLDIGKLVVYPVSREKYLSNLIDNMCKNEDVKLLDKGNNSCLIKASNGVNSIYLCGPYLSKVPDDKASFKISKSTKPRVNSSSMPSVSVKEEDTYNITLINTSWSELEIKRFTDSKYRVSVTVRGV